MKENASERKIIAEKSPRWPVYGTELILDLHGCDPKGFTREAIARYFTELCELIDMERCDLHFWDDVGLPPEECQTDPRTKGTTAIQFILTSNVTVHCLELLQAVYINIFSCDQFDPRTATSFAREFFRANECRSQVVVRT